jgi:1-aminocyclopropane-1-carboxylate deaminase/D-cysteine desulfhydrase-like pyridoxal-dependent ACC family enzyme
MIGKVEHLHEKAHELEQKVDYLIEVAGSGGDQAAVAAATAKLKASSDALEQATKDVGTETK